MPDEPKYTSYGDRGDVRGEPTPYGPHHDHKVDEAAGGADNSPLDTEAPAEHQEIAHSREEKGLQRPTFDQPQPGKGPPSR